jgi:hypothetical protein
VVVALYLRFGVHHHPTLRSMASTPLSLAQLSEAKAEANGNGNH